MTSFIEPDALSLFAFIIVIAGVIFAFLAGIYVASKSSGRAPQRTVIAAVVVFAWLGILSLCVQSGFLEAAPMPRAMIFVLASNFAGVLIAFSPVGGWLASGISIRALVGFQAFRLPLELILHSWAKQGTIPVTMTWEGANFDIVSGILALCCAPLVEKYKALAWIANGVGFILLLNVGRVAILSSPFPFAWQVSPPLLLAFHLPYAWIVPVCVAGALAGHLVLTRALMTREFKFK